ncbi:tRNA (adenosine(37)-N6)-threonylcarbamoyltransferase complex dimerization subunit type 1 TsaB [Synergistaceae bacterium OttesenSCG-928-I11]|nr:tRNA (adenosine(37)-N6)-threonylcarbamoyltransferase complex dimerization subunit type 1 TsaB [Synergistaceae bacterium OttesenSCG-928-I11]
MPLTLAIDCAMRWINLGLGEGDTFLGCESIHSGAKQGDVLPVVVGEFISRFGRDLSDVERIAITVGPGYYTGIRVGLSYATALAESLGANVVPMTTLHAMAYGFFATPLLVVPVVKARTGAVYAAAYHAGAQLLEETFLDVAHLIERIAPLSVAKSETVFLGEDAERFPEIAHYGAPMLHASHFVGHNMIAAAREISAVDPTEIRALYLRNPD